MKKLATLMVAVLLLMGCGPLGRPSAEEIVRRAEAAMEALDQAHAVVEVEATTAEGETLRVVGEAWMQGEASRATVLEASEPELAGTLLVSDGATGWLYHPDRNQVLTGDVEALQAYREEQTDAPTGMDFRSLTEAVDELLRITNQELVGEATIAGLDAWHLRLTPNEEAPPQLAVAGGVAELWISKQYDIPLQLTVTADTLGAGRVTVREYEAAPTLDASLFQFAPPAGAEVVDVATLLPERMTLAEARAAAGFSLLSTPADRAEAALVDVYRLRDAFVQEFDGTLGQWKLVQSQTTPDEAGTHSQRPDMADAETVTVRGTQGWLHADPDAGRTVLAWQEGGAFRLLSGTLAPDAALRLAEALE